MSWSYQKSGDDPRKEERGSVDNYNVAVSVVYRVNRLSGRTTWTDGDCERAAALVILLTISGQDPERN